jgi:hypothetical protein
MHDIYDFISELQKRDNIGTVTLKKIEKPNNFKSFEARSQSRLRINLDINY